MKTAVKTFLINMLLILTCSISRGAVDFVKVCAKFAETRKISAMLSSCFSTLSKEIKQESPKFADIRLSWTTDIELGTRPLTEIYSSNQQCICRVIGDSIFLRNIFLISSNHEDLLVHGRAKQHFSDKDPYYVTTGSNYYTYTFQWALIQPLIPF